MSSPFKIYFCLSDMQGYDSKLLTWENNFPSKVKSANVGNFKKVLFIIWIYSVVVYFFPLTCFEIKKLNNHSCGYAENIAVCCEDRPLEKVIYNMD